MILRAHLNRVNWGRTQGGSFLRAGLNFFGVMGDSPDCGFSLRPKCSYNAIDANQHCYPVNIMVAALALVLLAAYGGSSPSPTPLPTPLPTVEPVVAPTVTSVPTVEPTNTPLPRTDSYSGSR